MIKKIWLMAKEISIKT